MKKQLYILPALLLLIFMTGCKDKTFEKAQKIFNKDGYEVCRDYIKKIKKYCPVIVNDEGATIFLYAVKNCYYSDINTFVDLGADINNEKDSNGKSFFDYFIAIDSNEDKCDMVEIIPSEYWTSYIRNNNYETPIEYLLDNDIDIKLLDALQSKKALSDSYLLNYYNISKGKTVLMYAAQHNTDEKVIAKLLEKTAQVNSANSNNWTAIMYAARYNPNPSVLEEFVKKNAILEPNKVGITLTMLASCNPNPGVLLKIPNSKEQINLQAANGKTALMYACENGQDISTIRLLVRDLEADLDITDNDGKTALMYAKASNTNTDVITFLLDSGASTEVIEDTVAEDIIAEES